MSKLRKLIDGLTEFGTNPKVESSDKVQTLKKLLVGIYSEYVNVESVFDNADYEEEPDFDYNEIKSNVQSNFKDFGWYGTVLDLTKIAQESETAIGDAIDDLTDIIKDMLVMRWKMENTSQIDALWEFEFSMRTHSEQHLLDLLKYIKETT